MPQRHGQPRHPGVGQRDALRQLVGGGDGRFDLRADLGAPARARQHACDHRTQPIPAGRVGFDGLHELRAAPVQPAAVKHCCRSHRRRQRILDHTAPTAPVDAVPAATHLDAVDDVHGQQLDTVSGELVRQGVGQVPVGVAALQTVGAVLVHDDGDRAVRFGRRGDLGQVRDRFVHVVGKIDAHDASQLSVIGGHDNQRLLGTNPSTAGSAAISEPGWSSGDSGVSGVVVMG